MLYYCHCHKADAALLPLFLPRLRELDHAAHIIIANDPANPVPEDELPTCSRVETVRPAYPLGGNLNGYRMVEGMLSAFIAAMEKYDTYHIVKIDCDAWLNSVEWLHTGSLTAKDAPEWAYIGLERREPFSASGTCYRISRAACKAALRGLRERKWPLGYKFAEDRTILALVLRSGLPVLTIPYIEGRHVGMHESAPTAREAYAWAVHCGESMPDGRPAPRTHVLHRMQLLHNHTHPATTTA